MDGSFVDLVVVNLWWLSKFIMSTLFEDGAECCCCCDRGGGGGVVVVKLADLHIFDM